MMTLLFIFNNQNSNFKYLCKQCDFDSVNFNWTERNTLVKLKIVFAAVIENTELVIKARWCQPS